MSVVPSTYCPPESTSRSSSCRSRAVGLLGHAVVHDRAVRPRAADRVEADVVQRVRRPAEAFQRAHHVDLGQPALRRLASSQRQEFDHRRAVAQMRLAGGGDLGRVLAGLGQAAGIVAPGDRRRPRLQQVSRTASGRGALSTRTGPVSAPQRRGRRPSGGVQASRRRPDARALRRRTWPGRRTGRRARRRAGSQSHAAPGSSAHPRRGCSKASRAVGQGQHRRPLARRRAAPRPAARACRHEVSPASAIGMRRRPGPRARRADRARSRRPDYRLTGEALRQILQAPSQVSSISSLGVQPGVEADRAPRPDAPGSSRPASPRARAPG